MPTRPPIHRPAGHRTKQQVQAVYNATPQRREHQQMYDWAWRQYSKDRLARYPWCVACRKEAGRLVRARVTDHIRPHKGDPLLFRDPSNHQSLCFRHHNSKTATEDGGFGRSK